MKKILLIVLAIFFLTSSAFAASKTLTFEWQQDLNRTVEFSWDAASNAIKYQLRVHEDGTPYDPCTSMAYCADVTGLTKSVMLKPGTNYDWWVAGVGPDGTVGPSTGSSFTTVAFGGWKLYQASQTGGPYTLLAIIPFVNPQTAYQLPQSIIVPDGQKTTLFFALTAFNSIGESAKSAEVSAVIDLTPPIPEPPGGLGAGDKTIPIIPFTLKVTVTTP
jgi:hypothetical protein